MPPDLSPELVRKIETAVTTMAAGAHAQGTDLLLECAREIAPARSSGAPSVLEELCRRTAQHLCENDGASALHFFEDASAATFLETRAALDLPCAPRDLLAAWDGSEPETVDVNNLDGVEDIVRHRVYEQYLEDQRADLEAVRQIAQCAVDIRNEITVTVTRRPRP